MKNSINKFLCVILIITTTITCISMTSCESKEIKPTRNLSNLLTNNITKELYATSTYHVKYDSNYSKEAIIAGYKDELIYITYDLHNDSIFLTIHLVEKEKQVEHMFDYNAVYYTSDRLITTDKELIDQFIFENKIKDQSITIEFIDNKIYKIDVSDWRNRITTVYLF